MRCGHASILAGAGLLALAACGPTMRSDRDESVPVPRGATWAWAADSGRAPETPGPVSEIVQQRFVRAIAAAMDSRGYREVSDTSGPDFLLSLRFAEASRDHPPVRRGGAVAVGFSTGWGYPPFGFGRFGFYRPWGFYYPWAFYGPPGFYGSPMWGGYFAAPYVSGYRLYSDRALTVVLRHEATGYVAWSGRLGSDALVSHRLTQDRVQKLVDKLFRSLR